MIKNTVIGTLILGAFVLAGTALSRDVNVTVETAPVQELGAVTGPRIDSELIELNGVRYWYYRYPYITTGTTTPCAIPSPTATTTLIQGSASATFASTTATAITIANSATAYATTTGVLATTTAPASGQFTLNALSTSTAALYDNKIIRDSLTFGPGRFLVVGFQGGTGTFTPTGFCQAVFQEI